MMYDTNKNGSDFLKRLDDANITKEKLFDALFDARGVGADINTKHVFFQEVIIKFNASKARAVIAKHLPYETDSHYVDVALYRYIQIGGKMKEFDKELQERKIEYVKTRPMVNYMTQNNHLEIQM